MLLSKMFSSIVQILRLGPREYMRLKFKLPVVKFIYDTVNLYKSRTKAGVNNVREVLFRGAVIALITALLVWLSVFMYIAFYYVYVPSISHERPVFLKFKPCGAIDDCEVKRGVCSFPSAHVQLTKRQQLLMIGQPYKIHLDLDMPESPTNRDLGMFMVCVEFLGKDGSLLANSCRSTMLHYKGFLLDTLYKLLYSPFFVFGSYEEKQTVRVELFADYEEIEQEPVTDIRVEIQTRHIEIYAAKFLVNAKFSGLRYVMYHWPVMSAALGITANLFFIALVCLMSWYQILNSEEYMQFLQENNLNKLDSGIFHIGEELSLTTIGAVTLMPIFMSYDIVYYLTCKVQNLITVPYSILSYVILADLQHYSSVQGKAMVANTDDAECDSYDEIVCARHQNSGCRECITNNQLVFLT